MENYILSHIAQLEAEAIYVIREARAQFDNPAILFSGGKDSITMLHLARKAFAPGPIPFKVVHIDTGHNFQEALDFRDTYIAPLGVDLIVGFVEESIQQGKVKEEHGVGASRNAAQTITLLDTIAAHGFDCALGGGRRDEEKARAKERFFSHRDEFGQWDPKNQRPELWSLYNGTKAKGEHFRVFPLSNWTELDVWQYIAQEQIPLPSLYFSHQRKMINRQGTLYAYADFMALAETDVVQDMQVRFRTVGDISCTGGMLSSASTVADVIAELLATNVSERGSRQDDKRSEAAMEDRKKQGYF